MTSYFRQTYIIPVDGTAWIADSDGTPEINLRIPYMTASLQSIRLAAVQALETHRGARIASSELRFKGSITPTGETLTTVLLYNEYVFAAGAHQKSRDLSI